MGSKARRIRTAAVFSFVLIAAACTTQFRNHGYAPDAADLANLAVGSDTRETVAQAVGRPTAEGVLAGSAWYYVESRFRQFAYQAPREVEREVVAISFDAAGRLSNIERFGLEDGRVVTLSRRVTETTAARTPLLRSLLGNIGGGAGFFN